MIAIYNETQTPWKLVKLTDEITILEKSIAETENKNGARLRATRMSFVVVGNPTTDETSATMEQFVNMKDSSELLSKEDVAMTWAFKDMGPVITNTKHSDFKDFFAISLNMKGRILTNVESDNSWILDKFILAGDMSVLISLNSPSAKIIFSVFSTRACLMEKYTFSRDKNNELKMVVESVKCKGMQPIFKLEKFRPHYLTHAIIALSSDAESLREAIKNCKERYIINYVDSEKAVKQAIAQLKGIHYRAVSIFTDSENVKDIALYELLTKEVLANFNLVHVATYDKTKDDILIDRLKMK